ncbi:MAG: CHAT domain-containing protein, partial [Clostridia bacterium]|nr:CHAT domain-containing protein [Clostridia bacterium]
LQTAIEALRQNVPGFAYFFKSLPFPEIQRQAADAPLVYLLATPAGGLALVVSAAGGQAVDLPELTEAALNGWLVQTDAAGQNVVGGYLPAQLAVPDWMSGALKKLLPALGRALQPLVEALALTPPPGPFPSPAARKRGEDDGAAVRGGVRAITLIPTGRLALLPLHAARLPDGSHLLDHFTISYAPSAQALQAARRQAAARQEAPFFLIGVGNPLPSPEALADLHRDLQEAVAALPDEERIRPLREELAKLVTLPTAELLHEGFLLRRLIQRLPEDLGAPVQRLLDLSRRWPQSLRYAKAELQSVVDLLPPQSADPLYEQEATLPAVLERLPRATAVHLSCHGIFQADDPLQSSLLLVDEEGREARLTLRDLFAEKSTALSAARLVVLSACQTAVTDFRDLPEEAIGLPVGFLQAGVPAVIGTLWNVDDAATALLVTRMYEYMLQEHLPPPQAVRQAQRWLRDLTNADLEAYLARHEAIAKARLESGRRMPFTLLEELMVKVITTEKPQARPYADPYFWAPFTFTGVGEVRL